MTIGERAYKAISDRADQKGVGIVEYAKSIGISQPNLSNWKNNHSEPRAYLLSLMAEAGLDVHWILTGNEDGKVDVVRCKECASYEARSNCQCGYCWHWDYETGESPNRVDGDDYCSYGERRADNATD